MESGWIQTQEPDYSRTAEYSAVPPSRGHAGIIEPFSQVDRQKASEPETSEAVIHVFSLMALLCGDDETVSGGTL